MSLQAARLRRVHDKSATHSRTIIEPFKKIGEVTDPAFLDTSSGTGSWDYEVTIVM